MRTYKIQHKPSGKFSTGGGFPRFSRDGKAWTSKGALALHLVHVRATRGELPAAYAESEVVVFEEVLRVPVADEWGKL